MILFRHWSSNFQLDNVFFLFYAKFPLMYPDIVNIRFINIIYDKNGGKRDKINKLVYSESTRSYVVVVLKQLGFRIFSNWPLNFQNKCYQNTKLCFHYSIRLRFFRLWECMRRKQTNKKQIEEGKQKMNIQENRTFSRWNEHIESWCWSSTDRQPHCWHTLKTQLQLGSEWTVHFKGSISILS